LASAAVHLLNRLSRLPLATLDALHLALVREVGLETLATADRVMAQAAEGLGLKVIHFD
jgi:predicted nucleic acid-binding protein